VYLLAGDAAGGAGDAVESSAARSAAMCTVQSPSSSVSASVMVADMSDWSPEQLLRRNAATAAVFVVVVAAAQRNSSTAHALHTQALFTILVKLLTFDDFSVSLCALASD